MKRTAFLAALALLWSTGAWACGGGGYSAAGRGSAATQAQLDAAIAESARHTADIAFFDKAIAVARTVDFAIGLAMRAADPAVPGAAVAYNAGKAVGYAALGDMTNAAKSGVQGAFGALGKADGTVGMVGQAASFTMSAYNAFDVGFTVGTEFGPR